MGKQRNCHKRNHCVREIFLSFFCTEIANSYQNILPDWRKFILAVLYGYAEQEIRKTPYYSRLI